MCCNKNNLDVILQLQSIKTEVVMPNYVLQSRRVAKPGLGQKVLDAVVDQFKTRSTQGNVSISLNAPTGSGHLVVGARVLDSIDEIEEGFDNVVNDMSILDSIDTHCTDVQAQILKVLAPGENLPSNPKYMARNILKAKPGKAQELASLLLEIRDLYGDDMKPLITVPYVGNQDIVRATAIYDSLSSFEKHSDAINGDKFKSAVQKVRDLRQSYIRHTARMVYLGN